ncbi:hypothetical protein Acsp06_28780 [Actinomycetospora sp. NBRC 106375]|uniref:hypothetical protein n=1 Tax=Actinomycetospora sp. NBRC 106375 TaxID=3032207 RepID=UPI0024A0CE47|nr:hypothetical protein [Actinomycetospora sp. NBRC 106375]GLZ46693.1 hypothetical protein Acsp06_28780 [Actinomycetospora sp. NBRC 106375]
MQVLAVDWSGDGRAAHRRIRVASAAPGRLLAVHGGLDRAAVADLLLARAADGPLVAGLDFSFALPAWFPREHGCADVDALWSLVEREGEAWLRACRPPFWGRGPTPQPPLDPARPRYRATEEAARADGFDPRSTFQIGGAGAVGTGSLRGMPHLARLRAHGVAVWPFDDAGPATLVEIYPRVHTGPVVKRSAEARRALAAGDPRVPAALVEDVVATEDAFDAALSALAMAEHLEELAALRRAPDGSPEAIEGALWRPVR